MTMEDKNSEAMMTIADRDEISVSEVPAIDFILPANEGIFSPEGDFAIILDIQTQLSSLSTMVAKLVERQGAPARATMPFGGMVRPAGKVLVAKRCRGLGTPLSKREFKKAKREEIRNLSKDDKMKTWCKFGNECRQFKEKVSCGFRHN